MQKADQKWNREPVILAGSRWRGSGHALGSPAQKRPGHSPTVAFLNKSPDHSLGTPVVSSALDIVPGQLAFPQPTPGPFRFGLTPADATWRFLVLSPGNVPQIRKAREGGQLRHRSATVLRIENADFPTPSFAAHGNRQIIVIGSDGKRNAVIP